VSHRFLFSTRNVRRKASPRPRPRRRRSGSAGAPQPGCAPAIAARINSVSNARWRVRQHFGKLQQLLIEGRAGGGAGALGERRFCGLVARAGPFSGRGLAPLSCHGRRSARSRAHHLSMAEAQPRMRSGRTDHRRRFFQDRSGQHARPQADFASTSTCRCRGARLKEDMRAGVLDDGIAERAFPDQPMSARCPASGSRCGRRDPARAPSGWSRSRSAGAASAGQSGPDAGRRRRPSRSCAPSPRRGSPGR